MPEQFKPKQFDSFKKVPDAEKHRFKPVGGGFVYAEALSKKEAENKAEKIQNYIKSGDANNYHGAEKLADSELGKKVIEGAKKYSDEEIANWNEGLKEWYTEFIDRSLFRIKESLSPEEFEQFNKALAKYPLIDLASGSPHLPNASILTTLFKEKYNNGWIPNDCIEADLAEPPKYIGVDKYSPFYVEIPENLKDRIKFEKKDLVEFLRTLPDNSVNIFIGGFDIEISHPKDGGDDRYRAVLLSEIGRVLAKGGYCFAAESPLFGKWEGGVVRPEDFGLEKVPMDENKFFSTPQFYKKNKK